MSPQVKKYAVLVPVFVVWLVGDLWTKQWADDNLANPLHPIAVTVDATKAGRTVGELVTEQLGLTDPDDRDRALRNVVRLPPARSFAASDGVFDRTGPLADVRGLYVFWRDDASLPPRRINKHERALTSQWLSLATPGSDRREVTKVVDEYLTKLTLGDWLQGRIRRLGDEDLAHVLETRVHPLEGPNPKVTPETETADGDVFLVEWRRIDVMGDWWKYLYAENPGAAFGFMRKVDAKTRDSVFFVLTIIVFLVILMITIRIPPGHWSVQLALTGILAGALGNFVDRIRYGFVIDFIDQHLGFMHWPTYNVADIAITVGVTLLVIDMLFNKDSPLISEADKERARERAAAKAGGKGQAA